LFYLSDISNLYKVGGRSGFASPTMSDILSYRTCAIAVPPSEQNSDVSKETIIGAIGGTSPASVAHAVVTKLGQLWDSGAVCLNIFFAAFSF
jgi:Flp pilus assembly CpaE family ATPase